MAQTFTYDLATDIGKVRLEIGDTTEATPLFWNEEIQVKLDERAGAILFTAVDLCEILATRLAGQYDFKWMDQAFSRSQASKAYAARADALRARAEGGSTLSIQHTSRPRPIRVDGYADDFCLDDETLLLRERGDCR